MRTTDSGKCCLLCGSHSTRKYYDFGAPNKIVVRNRICNNCGLVFQNPRSDYGKLKEYYENYMAITQEEICHIPFSFEEHVLSISRLRLSYLKRFLRDGDRVLDIGCGFGAMLKILRDESGLNLSLLGVNPEYSLVEFGKKNYGLSILEGMFEEQEFQDGIFDFIILDNVIEHLDNPRKSISEIRRLFAEGGRLFVATNNLDEPHGFFWQNFFPEHTVTFSPRTLKALLEVEGFKIVDQNFAGHLTYEGYHYPYQYCIGMKSGLPTSYDFRENGDCAVNKINESRKYIRTFRKKNAISKELYELEINKNPTILNLIKRKILKSIGEKTRQPIDYVVRNHTLPPEEYLYRVVLVAACRSDEDISLLFKMTKKSGLQSLSFVYRTGSTGELTLQCCPDDFLGKNLPYSMQNLGQFWRWIEENSLRVDMGIFIQLYDADLRDDALLRAYEGYHRKGKDHALVDYRQFTQALIEFVKVPTFNNINKDRKLPDINIHPIMEKRSLLIWPGREDYHYYFKDRFLQNFKLPKGISLDLSPACNKACDKCQFHSNRSPYAAKIKRDQIMPKEMAFKILKEVSAWPSKPAISTSFSGEPLIYPHIFEVIKEAKNLGLGIHITTNGLALSEETARKLIELGVDTVLISLDSIKEETYALLQPPGDLSTILENVNRLLEIRGTDIKPSIGTHFVMSLENEAQFNDYLSFWGGKVDFVSRAILQDQFKTCQCVLPLWLPLGKRQACWGAWNNLYIRWNGDISFCGFDIEGKTSKLNVAERSLIEIWNSDEFWAWREAQLQNNHKILYCRACPDWAGMRTIFIDNDCWRISRTPITETYIKISDR